LLSVAKAVVLLGARPQLVPLAVATRTMSSWWCCACSPKLGDDFAVPSEEMVEPTSSSAEKPAVLVGQISALNLSPGVGDPCSTGHSPLDEGSTPSITNAACDDLAECSASSVSTTTSADGDAQSSLDDRDTPTEDGTDAHEGKDAERAPDVRSELNSSELAAVRALEGELGEAGIEAVRNILVTGEALESCLLRFLKPQHFRVRQAAKALKAHVTWCASTKPADLAELAPGEICGCTDELLNVYMPTWHQGYDRQGRPVVFSHYGKFRFGPVFEAGVTVEKMLQVHVRNSERTARLCGKQSIKFGRDISTALIVMDVEGLDPNSLRHRCAFEWIRGLAKIDQEHYPERLGQVLIINAPSCLHYFYKSISWTLPQKACSLVRIFGSRATWEPVLLELVDASELPPQYGGSGPTLTLMESPSQ